MRQAARCIGRCRLEGNASLPQPAGQRAGARGWRCSIGGQASGDQEGQRVGRGGGMVIHGSCG